MKSNINNQKLTQQDLVRLVYKFSNFKEYDGEGMVSILTAENNNLSIEMKELP